MTEKMLTGTLRIKLNKYSSNILNKMHMRIYCAKMSQNHLMGHLTLGRSSPLSLYTVDRRAHDMSRTIGNSDQFAPSLIRIFADAAHMKVAFIHRYLESTQPCLNKLGRYSG